jgi:hypothetical protein
MLVSLVNPSKLKLNSAIINDLERVYAPSACTRSNVVVHGLVSSDSVTSKR